MSQNVGGKPLLLTRSVILLPLLVACGGELGDPDISPDAQLRSADASITPPNPDAAPQLIPAPCADGGDVRIADALTGNCYLRFDEQVTWSIASARCQAAGGHLASISSASEDAIVAQIAPDMAPNLPSEFDAWIGGNDIAAEGTWAWEVTGEPFAFMNWRDGEPNNNNVNDPDGEDCAVYEGDNSQWDDRSCQMAVHKYICEREATLE